MGLDIRLSYKKEKTLYEANGRSAFHYVREWVQSKGDEFYGVDIQLTREDVADLICYAVQSYLEDYDSASDLISDAISGEPMFYYVEFLGKLLAIKGSEDYGNYYLECDW